MKRMLCLLTSMICFQFFVAEAQTSAPNFFCVDPNIYNSRISVVKDYYQSDFYYIYDQNHRLVEISEMKSGTYEVSSRTKFYYDDNSYLLRSEHFGRLVEVNGELTLIVNRLEEYKRDENGYLINYQRSVLTGYDPNDPTLGVDLVINLGYNDKHLLEKAELDFQIPQKRYTEIVYNEQDAPLKMIQTVDGELVEREDFEYDENGKIKSLSLIKKVDGFETLIAKWDYIYDENGDIIKVDRDEDDFDDTYEYELGQSAKSTFLPRKELSDWVLYGQKNYTFMNLPLDRSFEHAPIKRPSVGSTFMYEINMPTSVGSVNDEMQGFKFSISGRRLSLQLPAQMQKGVKLQVLDLTARPCIERQLLGESHQIDLNHLPTGVYVLNIGEFATKIHLQ